MIGERDAVEARRFRGLDEPTQAVTRDERGVERMVQQRIRHPVVHGFGIIMAAPVVSGHGEGAA